MLFNSVEFFVFLFVVYVLYRVLPLKGQNWMLLAAGYLFYGWWDVRFLYLIILSTAFDFSAALMTENGRMTVSQRIWASLAPIAGAFFFLTVNLHAIHIAPWSVSIQWDQLFATGKLGWMGLLGTVAAVGAANLVLPFISRIGEAKRPLVVVTSSIVVNLLILGFFKYFNFFIASANAALSAIGLEPANWRLHIILPVGISFYTFQSMSYVIDVYRKEIRAITHFVDFARFVAYFPQLVAGPIERAANLLPRLMRPRIITFDQTTRGLYLILFGLFKKVAIADGVAASVNAVYAAAANPSWIDICAGTLLFAIQIYCDFSGYSDIARGTSKLLGIDIMVNFRIPYFTRNPSQFWQG